jgi:hypothetical protein
MGYRRCAAGCLRAVSRGKIAGKQGQGQTILELGLMISYFAERRSLDRILDPLVLSNAIFWWTKVNKLFYFVSMGKTEYTEYQPIHG